MEGIHRYLHKDEVINLHKVNHFYQQIKQQNFNVNDSKHLVSYMYILLNMLAKHILLQIFPTHHSETLDVVFQ